jgi:hypothetical protein
LVSNYYSFGIAPESPEKYTAKDLLPLKVNQGTNNSLGGSTENMV